MFENCVEFAVIEGKRLKISSFCILEGLSLLAPRKVIQDGLYATRHLHISHNAPYPPPPRSPQILQNLCFFSFLLGITAIPGEIENNAYSKF